MIRKLSKPLPPSYRCHYSNPKSQGTLITETYNFPEEFDDEVYECWFVYSDRLPYGKQKEINKLLNVRGEQAWVDALRDPCVKSNSLNTFYAMIYDEDDTEVEGYKILRDNDRDAKLREISKCMFNLNDEPLHFRAIFYYNVSNGYNCPVFQIIKEKSKKDCTF